MINFGPVPANSVLPVFFDTYAGSTGASITITGLAVTDIEIYKGTSMTQRSSDNGYALIDTDGIDVDTITGIHGFSIDLSDNTDAGFYAAGSFYTVIVSAITVDSQTVNFVAATFRIVAAENTAGTPVADTVRLAGTVQTARDIGASVLLSSGTGTGQVKLSSGYVAPNWGDVGNPTTTVGLSGTTISTATTLTNLPAITSNWLTAAGINAGAFTAAKFATDAITADAVAADVIDEIWDEVVDGTTTARQSIRLANAALGGKASGLNSNTPKYRDLADTKDRIDAVTDASGNRTTVTRDLT